MGIVIDLLPGQPFELLFELDPEAGPWERVDEGPRVWPEGPERQARRYRSQRYTCDLAVEQFRGHRILSFVVTCGCGPNASDRECEFTVRRYGVRGVRDFVDCVPFNYRYTLNTIWSFREFSNASTIRKPFMFYGNRQGTNRLALGFCDLALDTEKTAHEHGP